jgi:hypothetical protein
MNEAPTTDREQTIAEMMRYPVLAHHTLFKHRHPAPTPRFHHEIVRLWHGTHPQVLIQAFRGAAKSTLAEEAILIQALLRASPTTSRTRTASSRRKRSRRPKLGCSQPSCPRSSRGR